MINFLYNTTDKEKKIIFDSKEFKIMPYEIKVLEDVVSSDKEVLDIKLSDISEISKKSKISGELFISSEPIYFIYDSFEYKIPENTPFPICDIIKERIMHKKAVIKKYEIKHEVKEDVKKIETKKK